MDWGRFIRFGAFELEVPTGELRKHGITIRLQNQSFQILLMLLERPGEVVLRTDIRDTLWPGETVSDFDQSINAAVRRLRTALGDSAEEPAYIETLAKRGYRFIGQVEPNVPESPEVAVPPVVAAATAIGPVAAGAAPIAPAPAAAEPLPKSASRRRWLWLAAASLVFVGFGYRLLVRAPDAEPLLSPIRLTTLPGLTSYVTFSPDGESIAYSWVGPPRNGPRPLNVYIKPVGSGEPRPLTNAPYTESLPQWSPDGSTIAVQRTGRTGNVLVLVPVAGGAERETVDMGVGMSWSPDGKEIAYAAPYPTRGNGGIRVRALDTGRDTELTDPRPYADGLVAWSPDGKQLAFVRSLSQSAQELFVVPARGGTARRLTFDNTTMEGFTWTGDGRDLVFSSYRSGGPNLWRIAARGGTPVRVASMAHHPVYPAIARRGNRLAFTESFQDSNIWEFNRAADKFQAVKCVICSTLEDDSPRFSPDGRKVVFISKRTGVDELWVADSDGGHPVQLTSFGTIGTGSPRWSPDGRWIAFDSRHDGNPEIYVIGAEGGAARRLTNDPASDLAPGWSHDGKWVYFSSTRGNQMRLWKVAVETGLTKPITEGNAGEALESPDGKRLYYFRTDHQDGIWTVPVEGGAEQVVPQLASVKPTRSWTVGADGIYFHQDGPMGSPIIQFFSFVTRRVTTVATPGRPPVRTTPGLDISPDGRRLLYTQVDQVVEGLLMIPNFR